MDNKGTCVVVGAGPGLGLAVARRFARDGFRIVLMARREDALRGYVEELEKGSALASGIAVNVADFAAQKGAFEKVEGPIEVLVYNAAVAAPGLPSTIDPADLVEAFKVNVAGALCAAEQVIPGMRARKRGTILFTGGGLALTPSPQVASLSIGKAGIRSLALTLGSELEGQGIHVATVTVCGLIKLGTHFDPDAIADVYAKLHLEEPGQWQREVVYR